LSQRRRVNSSSESTLFERGSTLRWAAQHSMKYPSPKDIEEMKTRGYDQSVIEEATELSKRWLEKERLKETIGEAFMGVCLGQGVGLREAQGLDDFASKERCAEYRATDERLSGRPRADDLNRCSSSLSFFDAEGMRFHLPAYLLCDLMGRTVSEWRIPLRIQAHSLNAFPC